MADRWRAPGGWAVCVVQLMATPDQHDGAWIRITRYGMWVSDVRSPAEVEQYVALSDLQDDDGLAAAV